MEDQSRRFACDRCRGQKLRCERTQRHADDMVACKRCVRARAECNTSMSVRMGRPSHSEKKGRTSPRQSRRSSGPASTASFQSTGLARESVPRPPEQPAASVSEWDGSSSEFVNVGQDSSGALDFQDTIDIQHQNSIQQQWQNTSSYPELSHSTFPINTAGNGSTTTYQDGDGIQIASTPSLNGLDFDHLFGTNTSVASGRHSTLNSGIPHTRTNNSNEEDSPNGPLQSEDSMDFAIDPRLPAEAKEECLQKLSNLSADLLQDLKRIGASNPIDSAFATPSATTFSSAHPPPVSGHALNVGRMLEHSERFLDILQHVGGSPSNDHVPAPSPALSNVRYFDLGHGDSDLGFGSASTTTLSQLLGDGIASPYISSPASNTSLTGTSNGPKPSGGLIRPDIPTMLAVLTCYTCLIRIYNSVFSYIHRSMTESPSTRHKLLPPLPGLHLCGFKLEQHQNLQLEILARVSLHMLNRLEKVLDDIGRSCVNSGLLEESMAANLLNMIIKQSIDMNVGGQKSAGGSLKDITQSIRELLDLNTS
ncbi:hypothetical protein V495_06910 [Pseudogymnoascus sp. VKM F-4514 (FW-929)]|nr:hypothetical protein V490_02111 [Pseudogymnoascus sp. VKM F-3557]KFY37826.1 hypothetical protein V495_06910 [Pseudogymnoascus sp. VKM F-4514 (FW-929)]KFY53637.1 hypothetical protein V497_08330 [Pseudogymnoascus sp. VKM F-4516 (FW-969)]